MIVVNSSIIDLWSIGHLAVGILIGFLFRIFLRGKDKLSYVLLFSILIGWEIIENLVISHTIFAEMFGVESLKNSISDVIVGFIGFMFGFKWIK